MSRVRGDEPLPWNGQWVDDAPLPEDAPVDEILESTRDLYLSPSQVAKEGHRVMKWCNSIQGPDTSEFENIVTDAAQTAMLRRGRAGEIEVHLLTADREAPSDNSPESVERRKELKSSYQFYIKQVLRKGLTVFAPGTRLALGEDDYVEPADFIDILASWGFKRSCHWDEASVKYLYATMDVMAPDPELPVGFPMVDRNGLAPRGFENMKRAIRILIWFDSVTYGVKAIGNTKDEMREAEGIPRVSILRTFLQKFFECRYRDMMVQVEVESNWGGKCPVVCSFCVLTIGSATVTTTCSSFTGWGMSSSTTIATTRASLRGLRMTLARWPASSLLMLLAVAPTLALTTLSLACRLRTTL